MQQTNYVCGQAIVTVSFITSYLHFQHVNSTQVRILKQEEDFTLRPSHLIDSKSNKVHFQKYFTLKYPNLDFVNINCTVSQTLKSCIERDASQTRLPTALNSLQVLNGIQPKQESPAKMCLKTLSEIHESFKQALKQVSSYTHHPLAASH